MPGKIPQSSIYSKQVGQPLKGRTRKARQSTSGENSFKSVFQQELAAQSLKFSAHAQKRLESRGIQLTAGQMNRVARAVEKAAGKGSRESLVLVDDVAMIVSVTNRTVITAVDGENMKENVFTNIDSAVIT